MSPSRRDFIKFVVAGTVAAGCPIDLASLAAAAVPSPRRAAELRPTVDSENNRICHQIRDGLEFKRPPVSARHELVIVGGGISGLTTAYLSPHRDFLLLEKEPHWGGNAYGMDFHGSVYGTGAAFIESSVGADLATELGLKPLAVENWDGSFINGEFIPDTWGENIDKIPYSAPVVESFKKFRADMMVIDVAKRARELDNIPFSNFLRGHAPEIKQWWDCYGPSNWGTLSDESSAMVALEEFQSFAGEKRKDERSTWPGGIGALSKQLAQKLNSQFGERMLSDATIVSVSHQKHEVHVTYAHRGKLKTVAAKAVIMATPKYITNRLVDNLPAEQATAMGKIRYAPYPVVNIIYDQEVFRKGYDTWCPGMSFTDFVVADWTIRNQAGYKPAYNILSCYTPMREGDRRRLLSEEGARKVAEEVLHDVQKLFPKARNPLEVHIYRRGHPMFMATPGNFTNVLPKARKPFDRIFFANTDSEGPVSTTTGAIQAAHRTLEEMAKRLAVRDKPAAALRTPAELTGEAKGSVNPEA